MNSVENQKGLSAIAWLLIVVIAGILVIMGIRLVPVYMGSMTVASVMESAAKAPESTSSAQLREGLRKRLLVNDVDYVKPRDFDISREKGMVIIKVEYERRVPFLGNIDFIVKFNKRTEVTRS